MEIRVPGRKERLIDIPMAGSLPRRQERQRDIPLARSLPRWLPWLGLGQAKAKSFPRELQGPKHLGHLLLLFPGISKGAVSEVDQRLALWHSG